MIFTISLILSWSLLFKYIPYLRKRLLDYPNFRSSHSLPVPRGGGISFVLVSLLMTIFSLFTTNISGFFWVFLFSYPLAVVGLMDDLFSLSSLFRFVFQCFTSGLVLLASPISSEISVNIISSPFSLAFFVFLVFVYVSVINFVNFMDGLDGLVSGCMSIALGIASIHLGAPWPILVTIGSLLGFLVWNWSPARIFMGDVGSTFLGSLFASLVLHASSWPMTIALLLVITPLLGDTLSCLMRRYYAGHNVFQAHRLHLFQRLHQAGWSHSKVSLAYIAATALLGIAILTGGLPLVICFSFIELLFGVWLDQRVAVPFAVASNS